MKFDIYEGVILDRKDPQDQGRYYVYVPELQFNDLTENPPVKNKFSGIWCYNCIGNNMIRYTETELREYKDTGSYGTYMPLRPGTHVLLGLPINNNTTNWSVGYILNLITFEKPPNDDRDNFFLLTTTDKESWTFIDEAKGQFAVSLHAGKSNVWGNDTTIHLSKDNGNVVEVSDDHIISFHNSGNYCYVDGDTVTLKAGSSFINIASDHISIKSDQVYVNGASLVAIEGGSVQINDGVPAPDTAASKSDIAKPSQDAIKAINDKDKQLYTKLTNGKKA